MRDVVRCADAREALGALDDASCDAVITDPPYNLQFMGQQWDNGLVAHDPAFWAALLRVAKPGAFLVAFGGTRTYHRLACAIEDAGWECRDMLNWLYASGFPKSKSCLKPAHEPILLAKAPGPLQPLRIDACRVATGEHLGRPKGTHGAFPFSDDAFGNGWLTHTEGHPRGRWPSNLVLSHAEACGSAGCAPGCHVKALDEQAGECPSKAGGSSPKSGFWGQAGGCAGVRRDDTGGPSRFFPTFDGAPEPEDAVPFQYVPKASRSERNAGLECLPLRRAGVGADRPSGSFQERLQGHRTPMAQNTHPTVKPIALMQWLVRLVTPPGGLVLDPFSGSGSTLVACVREGMSFIGIDQDEQYCEIARQRVAYEQQRQTGPLFAGVTAAREG